jgi:hypothetical protein
MDSNNSAVDAELSEHELRRTERPVVEMALVVEIGRLPVVGREAPLLELSTEPPEKQLDSSG